MLVAVYGAFALAHLAIGVWGVRLFLQRRTVAGLTLVLPIFALVYDNTIAAIGTYLGEGSSCSSHSPTRASSGTRS